MSQSTTMEPTTTSSQNFINNNSNESIDSNSITSVVSEVSKINNNNNSINDNVTMARILESQKPISLATTIDSNSNIEPNLINHQIESPNSSNIDNDIDSVLPQQVQQIVINDKPPPTAATTSTTIITLAPIKKLNNILPKFKSNKLEPLNVNVITNKPELVSVSATPFTSSSTLIDSTLITTSNTPATSSINNISNISPKSNNNQKKINKNKFKRKNKVSKNHSKQQQRQQSSTTPSTAPVLFIGNSTPIVPNNDTSTASVPFIESHNQNLTVETFSSSSSLPSADNSMIIDPNSNSNILPQQIQVVEVMDTNLHPDHPHHPHNQRHNSLKSSSKVIFAGKI